MIKETVITKGNEVKNKKYIWIVLVLVLLLAALVSGFVLMQTSAEEILVQTLETAETITDGHAVIVIDIDSIEQDASGTVEVWAVRGEPGEDGHAMGAFRVEILEASEPEAQGAVIVSDGETLWAYSPSENKVLVATREDAQTMLMENEALAGEMGQLLEQYESKSAGGEMDHPETAEEAVEKLMEYFVASIAGSGSYADETATQIKLEPIPEQMPEEYLALGGHLNLWIGQNSSLPLAAAYTGGSMGEFTVSVLEFEVNAGIDQALFTFEIPEGAEVVTLADLEPQSLTLDEAAATSEFEFLTPAETPSGATLVDIVEVRGALVQRYTLPEGGSFTVAQGVMGENDAETLPASEELQTVELRGTTGNMAVSDDGARVLLTWTEGDVFFSVAGDLTSEQALSLAESLQ